MALLTIHDLKITTYIGCLAWERAIQQIVILNLEFFTDSQKIAKTDNITDALDYSHIAERLTEYVSTNHFQLIETLAEHVADLLNHEFNIMNLRIKVAKPGAIRNANNVSITIHRGTL